MEAVDYIRRARPEVAAATPEETAQIKASFERMAAERPGRIRMFLRRLSGRQTAASIAALLIVPAGAYAVKTEIIDDTRAQLVQEAIESPQNQEISRSLIEKCRELQAQGLENAPCAEALQTIDGDEGDGGIPPTEP